MATLRISEFQNEILAIPLEWNLFLGGGKGGSKSFSLMLLVEQHLATFASDARAVVLRRSYGELEQLIDHYLLILSALYGPAFAKKSFNKGEMTFHHPGGGRCEMGYLDSERDHLRYWGRGLTFLGCDEVGDFISINGVDQVASNMRPPPHVTPRLVMTANPGMSLHSVLENRYVREPWVPFIEEGTDRTWIYCPSTVADNPFVDVQTQLKSIEAIAKFDPDWARALQTGDWGAVRAGAFFGSAWQPEYSVLLRMPATARIPHGWNLSLSLDQGGGTSPTVCLFIARTKDGAWWIDDTYFPPGSVIIFAEVHDATDDLAGSLAWPITKMSEAIADVAKDYHMRPDGYADPQVAQEHNAPSKLIDVYRQNGIGLQPWKRHGRAERWSFMREYMDAAAPAGARSRPGLYVTANCTGWLQTVPYLPVDPRRRDDLDTRANDHWADASAGAWYGRKESFSVQPLRI